MELNNSNIRITMADLILIDFLNVLARGLELLLDDRPGVSRFSVFISSFVSVLVTLFDEKI